MKVLYVGPYVPSRLRPRPFHLLSWLSGAGHTVDAVVFGGHTVEGETADELRRTGVRVRVVERAGWRSCLTSLGGVLGRAPLQVAYCRSRAWRQEVAAAASTEDFDVVHYEHVRSLAAWRPGLARASVLDAVDCMSLLWSRRARAASGLARLGARLEAGRLRACEASYLPRFAAALASTAADAGALAEIAPGVRVAVVSNGVDAAHYDPGAWAPERHRLIFWGIMRYGPNVDAAVRLCAEILPLVRARCPTAEVVVAGSSPARAVLALESLPGVRVLGYVPDLRPHLAAAAVAAFPIRAAAGIQSKALEAMAAGLPAVVSPPVALALGATHGTELLVARTPAEFADHICAVLSGGPRVEAMRRAARTLVGSRFGWDEAGRRLLAVYDAALAGPGT